MRRYSWHGLSKLSEYGIWSSIKDRCYRKTNDCYSRYGALGIKVCDRWLNSFENFLTDMGPRPSVNHSVDRKDVHGDYSPSNCRWATRSEQQRNRRDTIVIEFNGVCRSVIEWAEITGIPYDALKYRVRSGWTAEEALTTPSQRKNTQRKEKNEK